MQSNYFVIITFSLLLFISLNSKERSNNSITFYKAFIIMIVLRMQHNNQRKYIVLRLRKQEEQSRLESFLSNKTCLPVEKRRNTMHSSNAGNKISTSTRPTVVKSSSPTSSTSSACSSSSSSTTIEKRLQTPRLSTDTQHFHFRPTNTNAPRKATFPRIEAFRNSQQEKY